MKDTGSNFQINCGADPSLKRDADELLKRIGELYPADVTKIAQFSRMVEAAKSQLMLYSPKELEGCIDDISQSLNRIRSSVSEMGELYFRKDKEFQDRIADKVQEDAQHIERLELRLQETKERNDGLLEKISQMEDQQKELLKENETLTKDRQRLEDQLRAKEDLEGVVKDLSQRLNEREDAKDQEIQRLQQRNEKLLDRLDELTGKLVDMKKA